MQVIEDPRGKAVTETERWVARRPTVPGVVLPQKSILELAIEEDARALLSSCPSVLLQYLDFVRGRWRIKRTALQLGTLKRLNKLLCPNKKSHISTNQTAVPHC